MNRSPDWTRTCEGCPDIIREDGAKGVTILCCGLKGRWPVCHMKGIMAGKYLPYVPAWCPKMH